jgi:superfamily I DNA/RNA helicase
MNMPEQRIANLHALSRYAQMYEDHCVTMAQAATIDGFMDYIQLGDLKADGDPKGVNIKTYHSSKGLDFDSVFMPFCNEPTKPETFMTKTLFMVAMTRSRQNLYLSYTAFHMNHNLRCFSDQCATKVWAEQGQPTLFPISSTTSNNRSSSSSHDDDDIFG